MTAEDAYPRFIVHRAPRQPTMYVCVAGPEHAVEIVEKTDPHNHNPLGFEYRILRSRATVKQRATGGESLTREQWFTKAAELMLTHLTSINDLLTICEMARGEAKRQNKRKPDYSRVIPILQSPDLEWSRRNKVARRLAEGGTNLLS
jgi:hypothetical protein